MDKRANFFKNHFEQALAFEEYIKTGTSSQNERWHAMYQSCQLSMPQTQLIANFKRKMNILVMSGIWCGDCIRQGPILQCISQANSVLNLRFIDNQANPELLEELRIQGGARVPVAVFLSEDFNELCRFGDRTLSAYRRKANQELGSACDAGLLAPDTQELNQELSDWLDIFERCQLILRLSPMLRSRYQD